MRVVPYYSVVSSAHRIAVSRTRALTSARELENCRLACEKEVQLSSLLLLAYESLKRAGERNKPLFDCHADEMITVPHKLHNMACCLLIANDHQVVTYLNRAAQEHLHADSVTSAASFTHPNDQFSTITSSDDKSFSDMRTLSEQVELAHILTSPLDLQWSPLTNTKAPRIHISSGVTLRSLTPRGGGRNFTVDRLLSCDITSPSTRIMGRAFLWDEWKFDLGGIRALGRPLSPPIETSECQGGNERYRAGQDEVEFAQSLVDNQVRELADEVRGLKLSGSDKDLVDEAVARLQAAKRRSEIFKRLAENYGPSYQSLIEAYLAS